MGALFDRAISVGRRHRTLCDVEMLVYDYDRVTVETVVLPAGSIFQPWQPHEHGRGEKVPITLGGVHTEFDGGTHAGEGHFLHWDDFFSKCEPEASRSHPTIMSASAKPLSPSPDVAACIQRRIDELQPESPGAWPIRVCKEELNALPLHANMIYLWAIQPDGVVLCLDHEAFGHPVYPETDPLITFAVVVQGARQYPELQDLVPAPPPHTRLCTTCHGTGRRGEGEEANTPCLQCRALGWFCAGPANPPEPAV